MTAFVIGINGGATHTTLIAVNRERTALARVEAGPSNIHNVGLETVRRTLHTAITEVIQQSGQPAADLIGIGAGLAGLDRPDDHANFRAIFEQVCPDVPLTLDNDGIVALIAAVGRRYGVVIISGTGSIALGLDEHGGRARAGGWGWRTDHGSGHAIGREVLSAFVRAHDGAIPPTALTERVTKRLDLKDFAQLISWMYAPDRTADQVAALAADAVALAETDLAATGIMVRAADALAECVLTVAAHLDFSGQPFPVVMSGGLFTHSALLRDRMMSAVQRVQPGAIPIAEAHDPAMGAALMALEAVQHSPARSTLPYGRTSGAPMRRATEQRNRLTLDIQRRPTLDLVTLMNLEDSRIPDAIAPELPKIARLIDAIAERFTAGGRLVMLGAGTSGRLAVLDAVECRPTFGVTSEQVIGIMAGGIEAVTRAIENAEDDEQGGHDALDALHLSAQDSVIGIAASGSTPFVIGALREAAQRGALTASIANSAQAPISALAQHPIVALVGAEVIMGSTRLRAGTAQKLILNMITTGVMVRTGRTFGNLMTDMLASNIKLRGRVLVIISEATGLGIDESAALLARSDGEMKTAIAAALLKLPPAEARQRLAEVNGDLNRLMSPSA